MGQPMFALFEGQELLGEGELKAMVRRGKQADAAGNGERVALYDTETGRVVDIDYRGEVEDVLRRLSDHPVVGPLLTEPEKPGPGRPKLGVVAKEITLLPRHWEWLAGQRGGASATLRRLVETASRESRAKDEVKRIREAIDRFLWDRASEGGLTGYEEATRSLYAGDLEGFRARIGTWPEGLVRYLENRLIHLEMAQSLVQQGS